MQRATSGDQQIDRFIETSIVVALTDGLEQGRLQLQFPAACVDDLDGKDGMALGVDPVQRIAACSEKLDGAAVSGLQIGRQSALGNSCLLYTSRCV